MKRTTSRARGIGIAGLVALMVGGVLLGTAVVASAAGAPGAPGTTGETGCKATCFVVIHPHNQLHFASATEVGGEGFTPGSLGAVILCNLTPDEPTIAIPNNLSGTIVNFGSLPVGCESPSSYAVQVNAKGGLFAGLGINEGTIGPPTTGTDSSGGDAATDAADYPCPPTQAQVAAHDACAVVFQDAVAGSTTGATENAWEDVGFNTPYSVPPTTTTSPPPPPGCTPEPKTVTSGSASVTVTPATCLQAGTAVTVTGSGLNKSDLGAILECNTAANEPTAWNTVASEAVPVGCSDPVASLISTGSDGTISPPATFKGGIRIGTIGPPFTASLSDEGSPASGTAASDLPTDSNAQATIDAAKFPCPPAGSTDGTGCAIVFGDSAPTGGTADQVVIPITFNEANLGTNPPATKAAVKKAATKASSGSLAFTGSGPGLWWLGLLGVLLMVLGGFVLAIVDGPRRLLRFALDHGRRVPPHSG